MKFKRAVSADVPQIIQIIDEAKAFLKQMGVDQWQKGSPNIEVIQRDINNENGWVLYDENDMIAYAAVIFDKEIHYENIQGNWSCEGPAIIVHRVAISGACKGQGFGGLLMDEVVKIAKERKIASIRIDTHEDNEAMLRMLAKSGFIRCGTVFLEDGSPRVAFDKILIGES